MFFGFFYRGREQLQNMLYCFLILSILGNRRMPYSLDLRKRAVAAVHKGLTKTKVCELYAICRQTLYNWLALEHTQGHLKPIRGFQKGHSHGISDLAKFKAYVDAHRDYSQEELAQYFSVGSSTIDRTLKKLGYSRKKRVKLIRKGMKKKDKRIKQKSQN